VSLKQAKHPSGVVISFDDASHRYVDNNGQKYFSVTNIVHSLFPHFDAERISGFVAKKRDCTRQEVLNEWDDKRISSTIFGSKIHFYAECLLNDMEWKDNNDGIKNLHSDISYLPYLEKEEKYKRQLDLLIPQLLQYYELIATEIIIFSPDNQVAGTIDLLMRNKRTGALCIFDWKTNEYIRAKNKSKESQTGLYQLSHILDSNFWHYTLQLSTYKRIIEREKYFPDSNFELAIFHIQEEKIVPYKLSLFNNEADYILSLPKNPTPELLDRYKEDMNIVEDL
jgi:hypothetical protein